MKTVTFKEALRYFISAAGIMIGVFVIVSVLEIVEGGKAVLDENFRSKGVKVYDIKVSDNGFAKGDYLQRWDGKLLEERMSEVKGSIPVLKLAALLESYRESEAVQTLAVNEKYKHYANLEMLKGGFISEEDVKTANRIAVIDDLTALELFGTIDIIGHKVGIRVGGKNAEFVVAGVFRNFNRTIETLFEEEVSGLCFIPDSVPREISFDYDVEKLVALVDEEVHKDEAAAMLGHLLEKEHGVKDVYSIDEYKQLPQVSEFTDKYFVFSVIAAIVGLISGSIGVMNIMLLLIQERKQELGLYRFFGSGTKELQFDIIYRTLVICLGCGSLGLILGVLAGNLIGSFMNLPVRFDFVSVFITIAAAATAGIAGSLYPASRIKQVSVSEAIWGE